MTLRRSWAVPLLAVGFAAVLAATTSASAGAPATATRSANTSAPSASGGDLPSWAIGPFTRYSGNPIFTPPVNPTESQRWEWPEAFNPSVVVVGGVFHMLYRGAASGNYSSIGAATSTDGVHFTEAPGNPVIKRDLPSETHGVEDPRMYYMNGRYYAFFTAYDGTNIGLNEATSTDAIHWTQLGQILPDNKNAVVIADPRGRPVKIDGSYLMYYGQSGNGTFLAKSRDLTHWTTAGTVHTGFPSSYEPYELCVAVTDYPTAGSKASPNIVVFVAGQLMGHGRWYYAVSEIEFTRDNLYEPADQLKEPILKPEAPYEIYGYTPHTVFMENIIFFRGQWRMYYGGGDSVIGLATAPVK